MSSHCLFSPIQELISAIATEYGRCKPFRRPWRLTNDRLLTPFEDLESRITSRVNFAGTIRTSAYLSAVLTRELLLIEDSFEWNALDEVVTNVCQFLSEKPILASSADDLVRVAQTAANGDLDVALKAVSALRTLGRFGVAEYSFHVANHEERICERFEEAGHFPLGVEPISSIDNPLIVVCTCHINRSEWQTLKDLARSNSRPILCFTSVNQVDASADIKMVVLPKALSRYETNLWLRDVAVWCGANVIGEPHQLQLDAIGKAGRVQSVNGQVLIYDPQNSEEEVYERIENYTQRIDGHEVIDSKVRIQDHLSAIGAPYVELELYALNETELTHLKHFTFAAMSAARSAIESGFVPGGCVRYLQAAGNLEQLTDAPLGRAVKNVLLSPFQAMFEGDDLELESAIQFAQRHPEHSFDASRQSFVAASIGGPLDATQFGIEALQDAVQTAKQLLRATL